VLLASGKNKAEAVSAMVEGPVSTMNTASALQLHPEARVFLDESAAGKLKMREYYDWVAKMKPGAPKS
jgi:glucosamine-6-phosphate deaminase